MPLLVEEFCWDDPTLHLYGKTWSFWSLGDWRITFNNRLIFGSDDGDNSEVCKLIAHSKIVQIQSQCKIFPVDPAFYFENGYTLEIFSDASYDTWTFKTPNDEICDFNADGIKVDIVENSLMFSELISAGSLCVDKMSVEDSQLILQGNDWKFSVYCSWRIVDENSSIYGRSEPKCDGKLPDLTNSQIQSILVQSERLPIDPVILFSNRYRLELFTASAQLNWEFLLPSGKTIKGGSHLGLQ